MKKLLLGLPLSLLFACSAEETTPPDPNTVETPAPLLIKSIKEDGVVIRTYEYDEENRLKEYVYYWPEDVVDFVNTYDYEEEVTTITGWVEGEFYNRKKQYWQDSSTIREDIYFSDDLARYILYKYSDETCGYTSKEIHSLDNATPDITQRTYQDENCSWRSVNAYEGKVMIDATYILDDKKNFDEAAVVFPFFHSNGNTNKYTQRRNDGSVIEAWSYTSAFEYNVQGYPVSEIRSYLNGKTVEYSYEYH